MGDVSQHNKINIQEVHFVTCFLTLFLPSWQVLLVLSFDSLYHFHLLRLFVTIVSYKISDNDTTLS